MNRTYAGVSNNKVVKIVTIDEADYQLEARPFDLLLDVSDQNPSPQVGWELVAGKLQMSPEQVTSINEIVEASIKRARLFGANLVGEMADKVGTKNILMGKTEAQIIAVVVQLEPIKKLLEGGALRTARTQIGLIRDSLPEYSAEFDIAIAKINSFLGE